MIEIKNLSKQFYTAEGAVEALKDVSLSIPDGDIFGIIGMSGAGKSTLVRCINMLERPTQGSVIIDGVDLCGLPERRLRELRRDISMIFQGFNLLMQRDCLSNICFPLELAGKSKSVARKRALELLDIVGLGDKAKAYPAQLSGGQQQRVAIARALATDPKVLLCDEATSALDPTTTNSILELIRSINEKLGITVIIITHQMSVVESVCKHVAILDNGAVVEQGYRSVLAPEIDGGTAVSIPGRRFGFADCRRCGATLHSCCIQRSQSNCFAADCKDGRRKKDRGQYRIRSYPEHRRKSLRFHAAQHPRLRRSCTGRHRVSDPDT